MRIAWIVLFCTISSYGIGAADPAAALKPVDLRCEYQANPLCVAETHPRLFWKLQATQRNQRQTAYQIVVATSNELLGNDQPDLWNSGKTVSDEMTHIAYSGRDLQSLQRAVWKVRVWDGNGTVSDWSQTAEWTMGIIVPQDWRGKWIGREEKASGSTGLPLLRKSFDIAKPVQRALVCVSGLGHYDLFLDGRKVGDRFLDPAWSVYEKTVYYTVYDITAELKNGPHVFGVMLGKGFYNTSGDRRVHGVNSARPLKMILQAQVTYADGHREWIVSDGSWRTTEGPITHSAILGGEDFDARKNPIGWDKSGFDDSAWSPAVETDGPGGKLTGDPCPPLKSHEIFHPARIDEPQTGVFVYDFGQNASAVPRIRVRGKAGQTLRLIPAEQRHGMSPRRNDGQGLVNPAGVGNPNYWQCTLGGDSEESWTPQFSYSGFQFLQLEGGVPAGKPNPDGKPVVEEIVSVHIRNASPIAGHFECSSPLINDIDRLIDWAVRSNLSHVLTDCPHREKLGWLEVAYLMGPSIAGRYDIARFYAKISRDSADSQAADGMVPTVAPAYPAFSGGFAYTPEWGAAAVVVPWIVYEWYGDRRILESSFPTMKGFVDYMRNTSHDLVPKAGLGDWYDYGHGKPVGASQFTPVELSAMATFFRCARITADTAKLLGVAEDWNKYEQLSEQIRAAFNKQYFNGANEYRNLGSPQTANSMALVLGLVPEGQETAVLDRIVADIRQRNIQQTAGDIGHWYLIQALARAGRSDVLFDLTARSTIGSYGFIVRNGWTSMPEAWDADTGASMNHCMLGHIQEWLLGWVAGIRPDPQSPGFRRVVIDPHPVGNLTWAKGEVESIRGPIRSQWRREETAFSLEVTLPPNTHATMYLPAQNPDSVTESGRPLESSGDIKILRKQKDGIVLEIGSGNYQFRTQIPQGRL